MFTDLIDIFTLLATLPSRGVVLTEAAFVIVTSLFALELAAPLIVLAGLIVKASALIVLTLAARFQDRLELDEHVLELLRRLRQSGPRPTRLTASWRNQAIGSDRRLPLTQSTGLPALSVKLSRGVIQPIGHDPN